MKKRLAHLPEKEAVQILRETVSEMLTTHLGCTARINPRYVLQKAGFKPYGSDTILARELLQTHITTIKDRRGRTWYWKETTKKGVVYRRRSRATVTHKSARGPNSGESV